MSLCITCATDHSQSKVSILTFDQLLQLLARNVTTDEVTPDGIVNRSKPRAITKNQLLQIPLNFRHQNTSETRLHPA
jgi:hypothetical protein